MKCFECGSRTMVYDTRYDEQNNTVIRVRHCKNMRCLKEYKTVETAISTMRNIGDGKVELNIFIKEIDCNEKKC